MNRHKRVLLSLLFGAVTALNVGMGQADSLDISDVPLFLGGGVQPNIMFTLDDSGSMHWELMPDFLTDAYYVYPRAAGVYGGSDYSNYVADFDPGNGNSYAMASRSNVVNKTYYDPNITYQPWSNSDGSLWLNAVPACAPHNPYTPDIDGDGSTDCRDLTVENEQEATWIRCTNSGCTDTTSTKKFWPAVYYVYTGGEGEIWDSEQYTQVEIKSGSIYSNTAGRSDCTESTTCTYAEEIQNFANWYSYYRSRILLARAGVGRAFSRQGTDIRVGFASINHGAATVDGDSSPGAVINGVRPFSGTYREDFFASLYGHVMSRGSTPLRRALDNVGQYFQRDDNPGPWGETPGTNVASAHLTCRQSYNILMTDGYWNGADVSTAGALDADDVDGPWITGPNGQSFQYTPADPYKDGHSKTLADVAMYYWNRDLRENLDNAVPTSSVDVAFWQHLVNFTVGLGVTGTLDPHGDLPDGVTLEWPNPTSSEAKVDDLWHAAVNSRGGFFSAANPTEFADALSDTLNAIAEGAASSAAIATNSSRLNLNTYIFQARFDSSAWWYGELFAFKLDEVTGDIQKPDPASWSSPNVKDSGTGSWEAGALLTQKAWSGRELFSYDPASLEASSTGGIIFEWANLSDEKQTALNQYAFEQYDDKGSDRLDYLAGDRSREKSAGGTFRDRFSVLGDIVHSDPWFVGTEDYGYSILPDEGESYVDYRLADDYKGRKSMIYVGANDGMLHGFDAETGEERFAYIPGNSIADLWQLTDPEYSHLYFVDGSPKSGDVYVGDSWKTYLVGTTGAGGKAVFALDVSGPVTFGAEDVKWEFTEADDPGDLGYTMGQASIVRMADGKWAAVFGNGYDSTNQHAVLYIVDISDGSIIQKIDTGAGGIDTPNGLSTPLAVDYNRDGITDRIYAGDLLGNMWSFDVTDGNASKWSSAYPCSVKKTIDGDETIVESCLPDATATPEPLSIATDESGNTQPITAKPVARLHPEGGVMVYFGTGKYFEVGDGVVGVTPAQNTFYGIRDYPVEVGDSQVLSRGVLQEQKVTHELSEEFTDTKGTADETDDSIAEWDIRVTTKNSVDWATKKGWYMDLALQDDSDGDGNTAPPVWEGERVISRALLVNDRVVFSTVIPDPDPCTSGGNSWLMELSALDGARLAQSPFDLNNDGVFSADDYVSVNIPGDGSDETVAIPVSGKRSKVGIIKTPSVIKKRTDTEFKYTSGSSGAVEKTAESSGYFAGRQSWRQLR